MPGNSPHNIFMLHLNWGETLFFNFFSLTKFFFFMEPLLKDTGSLRTGKWKQKWPQLECWSSCVGWKYAECLPEAFFAPFFLPVFWGMLIKLCLVEICRVVARGIGALAKPMRTIYLHLFTFFNFTLSFLFLLPFLKKLIHMISAAF